MPWHHRPRLHLAQKLSAFTYSIGRSSEAREVSGLQRELVGKFESAKIDTEAGRDDLVRIIAERVLETFEMAKDHPQFAYIASVLKEIMDYESMFVLPRIDDRKRQVSEWWELRDQFLRQRKFFDNFDQTCDGLRIFMCSIYEQLWKACPGLLNESSDPGITVPSKLVTSIPDMGGMVQHITNLIASSDMQHRSLFDVTTPTLDYNLILASGGNPNDPQTYSRSPKHAEKSDIDNSEDLVRAYLGGTPLPLVFEQAYAMTIPTKTRFEHHHIVGGAGHGKTQALQYLIANDIRALEEGKRSIVIIDSSRDLINTISKLDVFAPGRPLHDRLVIIDPTDIEWPVALNLFDVGQSRLAGYKPLERERLTNSILELYDFVLGSLLDAQMTQKQNVIFRYVTRLMLHIPNATIHTLRDLMEPGADAKFAEHIAKLSGSARHFFENEFSSREFEQTKKQVLRRLYGILENQTFERMFSHPRSKLDLYSEMNEGKVILINTAKDLLKESGTEIFGRFFIAMIAQAAQERAVIPRKDRTPTFVYIDEAADYFDRNIGIILSQARKYNVGMILAHQYLGQLDNKLQEAFDANTSIKFAGGVSSKDARALAPQMYTDPMTIQGQDVGTFAAFIKGTTSGAVPMKFPIGFMERMPRMEWNEEDALRDRMRRLFSVHYTEVDGVGAGSDPHNQTDAPEQASDPSDDDPLKPGSAW